MTDRVFDADGHIIEKDRELLDYFDLPYRGKEQLLSASFFPTLDGWHRQATGIGDGRQGREAEDNKEHIIPTVVNMVGEDHLFYASDYPHERDQEETIGFLRSREDLSEDAKEKILYQNAKKFYRLN